MFKIKQNPIFKTDIRSKFRNSFKSKGTISVILVMLIFGLAILRNFKGIDYELKVITRKEWLNKFYQDGGLGNFIKIDRTGVQSSTTDIAINLIVFYCLLNRRPNKDDLDNTDISSEKITSNKMNYFY
jgi:hypothetical protein